MRFVFTAFLLVQAVSAFADGGKCPPNYGYSGYLAPEQWQYVKEWKCALATTPLQSPIDVARPWAEERGGPAIAVRYAPAQVVVMNSGHDFRVFPKAPGAITVGNVTATLDQFHFHTPSEHTLEGRAHTAGEIHFVHEDPSTKKIYVIAVLLDLSLHENPALQPIIDQLPLSLCDQRASAATLDPLLPETITTYYRYVGSLTTPACDGDVTFFVLPTTMTIGGKQLDALRQFGENDRPQQPRNDRRITLVLP